MTPPSGTPAEPAPASRSARAVDTASPPAASHGRAGRDLRSAVGVGVVLAVVVLASLLFAKEVFLLLLTAAVVVGMWELRRVLGGAGIAVPFPVLAVGAVIMEILAYRRGAESLVVTFGITVVVLVMWRLADRVADAGRDVGGAVLLAIYPGFLAGFAALLLAEPDGHLRIIVFLLVTVFSDIGGYAVGVLAGKHPLAPTVSPKKSWEGFIGSLASSAAVGAAAVPLLLHGLWWQGLVLGLVLAMAATLGDLMESVLKRDLGIKDMGSILPGHGGLMDRLDSLVVAVPFAWALLAWFVPVAA